MMLTETIAQAFTGFPRETIASAAIIGGGYIGPLLTMRGVFRQGREVDRE